MTTLKLKDGVMLTIYVKHSCKHPNFKCQGKKKLKFTESKILKSEITNG